MQTKVGGIVTRRLTENFTVYECRCRCGRFECDAPPMDLSFMQHVQELRTEWGKPLFPTSATRCLYHNTKINGAVSSQHLIGNAIDFYFDTLREMREFALLAEKYRFRGIGLGKGKVHLDDRKIGVARWQY